MLLMSKIEIPNYTQYVNSKIIERFSNKHGVIFGQNIVAGSRISGLGVNLDRIKNVLAINSPNVENTLMGFGLGLMLSDTDSAFIMKQHDFALLGLDQLTNTVNVSKNYDLKASFIILMVVVDSGFEGPQASLNNLDEFASLSRSPVHFLNTRENVDAAFLSSTKPGLHMMALSQKSMKSPVFFSKENSENNEWSQIIECFNSSSVIFIYFGLDLQYLLDTQKVFKYSGVESDLIIVTKIGVGLNLGDINLRKYTSIIVIDTSKSEISYARKLVSELRGNFENVLYVGRIYTEAWSQVNQDLPEISPARILEIWRANQQ